MMICFFVLEQLLDDDGLVRDNSRNTIRIEEVDRIVHVPLYVLSELVKRRAIQEGTGNSVVDVLLYEHVTHSVDLPF
jgi:hypothetical protein